MQERAKRFAWKPTGREVRLVVYLLVLAGFAAWKFLPRPWHPQLTHHAPHHVIYSSASPEATTATAHRLELLFNCYSNGFGSLSNFLRATPPLQVKLFKDRAEFRRINPGLGWAEAYYRKPYCRAYYSSEEINPFHWMLHEATHQLNAEVAHLELEKWLEEGIAEYFSTSQMREDQLLLGQIDPNTYPVWWIDELATSPSLEENLTNGSVIPLRAIITNRGGPSLNQHFNLYYLHWWTLTHFIFETPQYRAHALAVVRDGGSLEAVEKLLGPVEQLQKDWHAHVRAIKAKLSGADLRSNRRWVPAPTNAPVREE